MLDRDGRAEQSQLAHRCNELVRVFVGMLELGGNRYNVAVNKAAHRLDYIVVQRLCHRAIPFRSHR